MIHIEETRVISRSLDEVFAYVANFANTAEWDPGIVQAHRIDDGDVRLGSTFAVTASFAGRELPLEYEITQYDPPGLLALATSSPRFGAVDTIHFESIDGETTRVRYEADFELKGVMRLAEPFLRGTFTKLGVKAMDGLKATLG